MPFQPDRREFLASLAAGAGLSACGSEPEAPGLELWYARPAERWVEALPVGNGRLGAMVFGGTASERIQFNEDTVWQGEPRSYANPGSHRWLGRIRSLLFEGKQAEAEELAMDRFMSVPLRQKAYQSFADLLIERDGIDEAGVTGYRRSLDIENAVARVEFSGGGIRHLQEVFASFPKQVIAVRLAASGDGNLSFAVRFRTSHPAQLSTDADGGLRLLGQVEGGAIRFEARLAVRTDGTVTDEGERLRIEGASEATLLLAGATNFVSFRDVGCDPSERNAAVLSKAAAMSGRELRDESSTSHRQLFQRVRLDLGKPQRRLRNRPMLRIERFASRPDPTACDAAVPIRPLPAHRFKPGPLASRPTCREFGTNRTSRLGRASTRSTSTPR